MPYYQYQCVNCKRIKGIYYPRPNGGPDTVLCEWCGDEARKILSWVAHRRKAKSKSYPIPEVCK